MCGICGSAGFADRGLLQSMCERLHHRGPDSTGLFVDRDVGLGMTRLAMIDVAGGVQPAHDEEGRIWLVFNGEMYNYRPWLERLTALGHRFYSRSDSEVVVHLYEEYGPNFLERINGMFALALWDGRSRRLLLARDRLGVKPLYYARSAAGWLFASEISALVGQVGHAVDLTQLPFYLRLRFVPGEATLARAIRRVPAGGYLVLEDGAWTKHTYWSMTDPPLAPPTFGAAGLRRTFLDAVDSRLVSDVPLGVFLSGGLDSSAIVGAMNALHVKPIRTFSVGFGDAYDETAAAERVAAHFGTEHESTQLDPESAVRLLPSVVSALDEPLADPAVVPTYHLASRARRSVKGVLLGEGADELFGGYEQHRAVRILDSASGRFLARSVAGLPFGSFSARVGSPVAAEVGGEAGDHLRRVVAADRPSQAHLAMIQPFTVEETAVVAPWSPQGVDAYVDGYFTNGDAVRASLRYDLENTLAGLLTKADRMTMAHSLEGREPYLDCRLVDYARSLPSRRHVGLLLEKKALREAAHGLLPPFVRHRRKRRFFVPLADWLRGALGEYVQRVLDRPRMPGILPKAVTEVYDRFRSSGSVRYARQLWSLLVVELWYRQVLLGERPA